jgi:hypothetical protein
MTAQDYKSCGGCLLIPLGFLALWCLFGMVVFWWLPLFRH